MKTVRFLLLAFMAAFLFTGCEEVAGDECKSNSDCEGSDMCYAGYCSAAAPTAGLLVKLQLVDKDDVNANLSCAQTNVKTVKLQFKRTTHVLDNPNNENTFSNGTPYNYTYTIDCEDLSMTDLGSTRGYYVGGDIEEYPGEAQAPMHAKAYVMLVTLLNDQNQALHGTDVAPYEYHVEPTSYFATSDYQPVNDNMVKTEKVVNKPLNIIWEFNNGGMKYSDAKGNAADACSALSIDSFKVAYGALAEEDTDNTYEDYTTVPCLSTWKISEMLSQDKAVNSTIFIYAVGKNGAKLGSVESPINLSTPFGNDAITSIDLEFTVAATSNKK